MSNWPDEETGEARRPIEAYLVIRQSFSTLDARMFSLESESVSLSASIVREAPELHTLFVVYRNEARSLLREASPSHYGGMLIRLRGARIDRLDGEYWTDRRTKGELGFVKRVGEIAAGFKDAVGSFR